jgi:hypothetical protein
MKTNIYALIFLAFLASCDSKTSNNEAGLDATTIETDKEDVKEPKFEFKERVWDFGNITEGERVEHTFKFKNVGEGDLVISNCTASCGCTIPEWPKEPIPPGGEGQIKVEFNSAGKSDAVTKDITIFANTTPVKSTLQIKVFINKKEN